MFNNKTIGFIGGGAIATAIIGGIVKAGLVTASQIIASAKTEKTLHALETKIHIATNSNIFVAQKLDFMIYIVPSILCITEIVINFDGL